MRESGPSSFRTSSIMERRSIESAASNPLEREAFLHVKTNSHRQLLLCGGSAKCCQ